MYRAILGLAALLAIPLGASLDGQTTRPTESRLVERIDSLSAILTRADSVADVADAARTEERQRRLTSQIDTFQVGPFLVVARKREAGLAKRYFEQAWAHYASIVGTEPTALDGQIFVFGKKGLLDLDIQGGTRVSTTYMPIDRTRAIGQILGRAMGTGLPEDLQTWVDDFFIRADQTRELEWAYRSLVTTESAAVSGCYDGALARCWDAFGLDHQDEWATAWYTESERRSLVRRLNRASTASVERVVTRCLDDQRDDACAAVLAESDPAAAIPLPSGARGTLVAQALSLGGPSGYTQLMNPSDDPLKDRLVRASGVSADSLMSSWRASVFQARPDVSRDTNRSLWSTLMWFLVLAGISTRSTRWRLT